ncbi:MAG: response regulator [Pseudomonadota bacterium]
MRALHKILVVDDDPVVGKSFSRVLANKGYLVVTAENAADALTKLKDGGYEAIFTDIKMPGMDGIEFTERVKAKQPWTPVVIITGYGTTANEDRAKAAGVVTFLDKPLSPEMIENSAAQALLETAPATPAQKVVAPAVDLKVEPVAKENFLKNIALFILAPFIGLAYIVMLPFVGAGILTNIAVKALVSKVPAVGTALMFLKKVALIIAAPFVGLAFIVLLPFFGLTMLAGMGMRRLAMKVRAG